VVVGAATHQCDAAPHQPFSQRPRN
jgi:hypothetical protein